MRLTPYLASAALLLAPAARAQTVAAEVAIQQHRVESVDARASGRLVLVDGTGKRTTYKFILKTHGFPDGVRLLEEVETPEPMRVLVHLELNGHVTARLAHKDSAGKWVATDVLPGHTADPLVGSGFALEDLVDSQFFWKDQSLVGRAPCGSRTCVTLQSISSSADRTQYAKVVSSFDEKTNAVLHVIKTVHGSGEIKDFTCFDLRQSHGVSSATQIEVKISGKPGSTLFLIDHGSAKAGLTRADFDITSAKLTGPEPKDGDF